MRTRATTTWLLVPIGLGLWCTTALADGGTVRLSQRLGADRITVFTSPTPLRAGPVDVSVLVQDAETGAPIPGAEVEVGLEPLDRPGLATHYPATHRAATNKLFHAALCDFQDRKVGKYVGRDPVETQ